MASGKRPDLNVTPGACILGALALLLLPLRWLAAAFLAAVVHECFHALALKLYGIRIVEITVNPGGAVMETEPMPVGREVLCALAGPLGSFFLASMGRVMPETAVCAMIQGLYNLLPIFPLDGGRALSGILRICCPRHGKKIMDMIRKVVILGALGVGLLGFLCYHLGIGIWIPVFLLIRGCMERKRPCKEAHKGVQ